MKLHAIIDRRGPGQVKRASDGLDLYQLLVNHGPAITAQLQSAPDQLRADTATVARQVLVDGARRTSGWMRQSPYAAVTADDLAVVGRRLLAGLA